MNGMAGWSVAIGHRAVRLAQHSEAASKVTQQESVGC